MVAVAGGSAKFVIGKEENFSAPKRFPELTSPAWIRLQGRFHKSAPLSADVQVNLKKVCELYVFHSTNWKRVPRKQLQAILSRWRCKTNSSRKLVWSEKRDAPHTDKVAKIKLVDIFRAQNTKSKFSPIDGHRRQLAAIAAYGMDVAVAYVDYVLQELEDLDRRSNYEKLWFVWIALIVEVLERRSIPCSTTHGKRIQLSSNFSGFVESLQIKLPPGCRVYASGESLNRAITAAIKFGKGARGSELRELMKLWAQFDRVKRHKNPAVRKLLKRQHLLDR